MTVITYFWLKSNVDPKKVPAMTNNTLTWAINFILFSEASNLAYLNIYILLSIINTEIYLGKFVDSICYRHEKQI